MSGHPLQLSARHDSSRSGRALALPAAGLLALVGTFVLLPATADAARTQPTQGAQPSAVINASTDQYHDRARQHYPPGKRRTTPPRAGRFIYGHWTPYNPPDPSSLPANIQKHVVRSGDTLYDISKAYYNDALLWPALWDANSWVRDPHWIYPGDTLLVPPLNVLPPGPLSPPVASLPSIEDAFYPAGWLHAASCGHFLAPPTQQFFGEIIDQEKDPPGLAAATGEIVYINVGAKDGVLPGDEFAVVYPRHAFAPSVTQREREDEQVTHPLTNQKLGFAMQMVGRIKVVLLGEEVSTAEIIASCDGIEMGYDIYPFTELPMPLTRKHPRNTEHVNAVPERGRGVIVYFPDLTMAASDGDHCSIDLGSDQGVIPGDVFQIYRNGAYDFINEDVDHLGIWQDEMEGRRELRGHRQVDELDTFWRQRRRPASPPRLIGELVVLYTEKDTATARITETNCEIQLGDLVVYKPVDSGLSSVATVASGSH